MCGNEIIATYPLSHKIYYGKYGREILYLASQSEYQYQAGPRKGKIKQSEIARKIGCTEDTVRYWLNPNANKKLIEHARRGIETRKAFEIRTPFLMTQIAKHTQDFPNDPDSIRNEESLNRIDQMVKEQ